MSAFFWHYPGECIVAGVVLLSVVLAWLEGRRMR